MMVNVTRYTLAEMDSESWTFNFIHQTAFPQAMMRVMEMFDETDKYALANQMVKAGVLDQDELQDFFDRFCDPDDDGSFEMLPEDILLLYTVLDLNAKLYFTPKDDELKSMLKLNTGDIPDKQLQTAYDGMLTICSRFAAGIRRDYQHVSEFKERFAALDKLSEYL
jgi:hypothetical protein